MNEAGNPVVTVPAGHDRAIENHGWKVIVKADDVNPDDSADLLAKEMRILNSPEALRNFGTPTAEGQRARNCAISLSSVNSLTAEGHDYLHGLFHRCLAGKAVAKIESIDRLGSRELIDIKMTDGQFPFFMMLEIFRDGENKVLGIELLNRNLPVENFKDIAKFLRELSKEAPDKKITEKSK